MKFLFTLTFALLLTGAGAALAQTPDGLPPSLETVCDAETGAAYGHCNAYCEAMDCELANDSDPATTPHASANACAKVRSKFQQTTGRDVPCEVTCPCANVPGLFAQVLSGEIPIGFCGTSFSEEGVLIFQEGPIPFPIAGSTGNQGEWVCGLVDPNAVLPITPAQGQYCAQLLIDKAASEGVTCGPI
jgi:hypothetical protein